MIAAATSPVPTPDITAEASRNSSASKPRPATSFSPNVSRKRSSAMYMVGVMVGRCWSWLRRIELFQEEFTNGTWLTTVASLTPGRARSAARSLRVRASSSGSRPMLVICTRTSSFSTRPLTSCTWAMRSLIMNRALQMIAQVSAISSTISAAAVLCRIRVERMGRISMAVSGRPRSLL